MDPLKEEKPVENERFGVPFGVVPEREDEMTSGGEEPKEEKFKIPFGVIPERDE